MVLIIAIHFVKSCSTVHLEFGQFSLYMFYLTLELEFIVHLFKPISSVFMKIIVEEVYESSVKYVKLQIIPQKKL